MQEAMFSKVCKAISLKNNYFAGFFPSDAGFQLPCIQINGRIKMNA